MTVSHSRTRHLDGDARNSNDRNTGGGGVKNLHPQQSHRMVAAAKWSAGKRDARNDTLDDNWFLVALCASLI